MHPYISQALAEAYAADWIREAEARSRARIALEDAAARGQVSYRRRRIARRRPRAGLGVTRPACR
jgi:hypothetical protein